MKRGLIHIALLLCLLGSAMCAVAQIPDYCHFTHLKNSDGLPHQQVEAMAFDHDGRLWIGTRNGLACYDGYGFTIYYNDPEDSTSIPHNFVKNVLVDSHNNVWVGCELGFARYRRETNDFQRYDVGGQRVCGIAETHDGAILCCYEHIYRLDKDATQFRQVSRRDELSNIVGLAVSPDNKVYIASNNDISYFDEEMKHETFLPTSLYSSFLSGFDCIAPLFFDSHGRLWIGRNGHGAMWLDTATGESRVYDVPLLTNGTVRTITEDHSGIIYLGTEQGLNAINPTTGEVKGIVQDLRNPHWLNDNPIYCIAPDESDNLWIGTYFGGINILRHSLIQFRWIQPGYGERALRGKAVRRMIEPRRGELWMASEDGGVNIMDIATGDISHFDKIRNLGVNVHELFYERSTGEMWMGTFRNGLFRYNLASGNCVQYTGEQRSVGLPSSAVFCMVKQQQDSTEADGKLWVGTTQGLRSFDRRSERFVETGFRAIDNDFIYSLLVDSRNNLWIGTLNKGLFMLDAASGQLTAWNRDDPDNILTDDYITSLYEADDHRIFVGTNNGGLYYVAADSGELHSVPGGARKFGTVCSIIQDSNRELWVSCSNGLFNLNPDTMRLHHYTTADGLPENQFNFASSLQASDGRLYLGMVNGVVSFVPGVKKTAKPPMQVHLWNLNINNVEVTAASPDSPLEASLDNTAVLALDYNMSRMFSINYGIVDPIGASAAAYQVFVEGLDRDWRDVGDLRQFMAMDLPSGTYRLKLRATADSELWDNAPVRELVIKIASPWYLSWWAISVYVLMFLAAAYTVYRFARARMRDRESVKMAMMENAKREEVNREKMEFFTNISHELKTPLSLILAPLRSISQESDLSPMQKKHMDVAIANTNKMVGLIDELVTFNRIEAGNFQLYLQLGNPLSYIETMVGYFGEVAAQKNIHINVFTEDNGEEVWFSTSYLERILNNLLSNALKYTDEGGEISVRASIEEEASGGNVYLCLKVADTGIGIAPEELDNIFYKYYQTPRGYNTNHTGWGIGLATVHHLVELHKGSIKVESEMGHGSTFIVRLNVTANAFDRKCRCINSEEMDKAVAPGSSLQRIVVSSGVAANGTVRPPAAGSGVAILLVEDNAELLQYLHDAFSKSYNVYTATNGKEALDITAMYPIDIVVSDVMMPVMDGLTLCARLKNDLATSHIPVILLTAKNDEESTMKGFESGAESYVTKPFDPQILELRVRNILQARQRFLQSVAGQKLADSDAPDDVQEDIHINFNNFDQSFMTRINELIDANLDNSEFSIADITKEFCISRSLLHIKMKSFVNTSTSNYIKNRRLMRACQLLREGANVSETAYRTGYSDPNYFSKVFKKEYGVTPLVWKSQENKREHCGI